MRNKKKILRRILLVLIVMHDMGKPSRKLASGCHWIWEITRMLLNDSTEVDPTEKELLMMEWQDQDTLNILPSPR